MSEHNCKCEAPGFCHHLGVNVCSGVLKICQKSPKHFDLLRKGFSKNVVVVPSSPTPVATACIHLGERTGESRECGECLNKTRVFLFKCGKFGECSIKKDVGVACCNGRANERGVFEPCPGYQSKAEEPAKPRPSRRPIKWAYGVTTIPARRGNLLPATLASLRRAGFDAPRLFVDGSKDAPSWESEFGLEVTVRFPAIRTFGNWVLSLGELFIREPMAQRYAIFQDDIVVAKDLRAYLDSAPFPEKVYLNLYTVPENEALAAGRKGWYESNQKGKGALGLVFDRAGVITLLTHLHMIERPMHARKGWRNVDGGIVTAMRKAGYKELVHAPSLVQHAGTVSTIGTFPAEVSKTWRGEEFSPLEL